MCHRHAYPYVYPSYNLSDRPVLALTFNQIMFVLDEWGMPVQDLSAISTDQTMV